MLSRKASLALSAALAAAACTSAPSQQEVALVDDIIAENQIIPASRAERDAADKTDLVTRAAFWGREYNNNPGDKEAAIKLTQVLRQMGNATRASEVATQALNLHPDDPELVLSFAQASLDRGRPQEAVAPLARIESETTSNWRANSIIGVTLDQLGRHKDAQEYYLRAVALSPDNPNILTNLGLSYALAGDAAKAEETLRAAADLPGADLRVRQNLALVLGVQGKFEEAEDVVADSMPASAVAANEAYFKTLLTPSRTWDALRATDN